MEYMMNLEQANESKIPKKSSIDNPPELNKKGSYSHTPQPSLKNVSNDMVKIIEDEINQIVDSNKQTKKFRTYFFGICGGAASGKSKIANYFKSKIPNSIVISEKDFFSISSSKSRKKSVSDYLKDRFAVTDNDGYSMERKTRLVDLSNPECFDWESLRDVLNRINKNESILIPFYDQDEDVVWKDFTKIESNSTMVFVEGQFIFRDPKIRELLDMKIYIEVDDDIRLSRLALIENAHIQDNVNAYKSFFIIYEKYMKPSFEAHVDSSKKYANLILPNFTVNEEDELESDSTLEFIIMNMQNLIKKRT